MLKLLWFTGGLTLMLAFGIVTALALAPADSLPFPLNTLNQADACQLPCWHGIYPDRTSLQQVEAIMGADPAYGRVTGTDNYGSHDWRLLSTPADENDVIFIFDDQAVVTDIQLLGTGRAGQILEVLGRPLNQMLVCTQQQIIYNALDVLIEAIDPPVLPGSQVDITIELSSINPSVEASTSPWRGFRSNNATNAPCGE